jgi:hypothetical protein
VWLGYQLDNDWGQLKSRTCHSCWNKDRYPKNAEITICICGFHEGRKKSIWYFRCTCGSLNFVDVWASNPPVSGSVITCVDCEGLTRLLPRKSLPETPPWQIEAAYSNFGMWVFNSDLRRVHRWIRKFNNQK